ncbi:MAG: hypothetical protein JRN17_03310 [Nitrososphaerota archaeon]|nr:hypothetical protein [Nitrososphaerota archaeon]
MKRSLPALALIVLISLSTTCLGVRITYAQSPGNLLAPTSIVLAPVPAELPPGGSGVVVVQLVDANGDPSPARANLTISLFSSDPSVATVSGQVTVPFGKSHAEAQLKAGIEGSATLTATASGFSSGSAKVSASIFSDYALQLVPLNNPVAPGDTLHVMVGLLAAGQPYEAPVGAQVSITTSLPGIPQQTVEVQPGESTAYAAVTIPSGVSVLTSPFVTMTAAAPGFTAAQTSAPLFPQGSTAEEALVGPRGANLMAGSHGYLSVSLFNGTYAPAAEAATLSLFSSNSSVVTLSDPQVSTGGSDSAIFEVYANATGTAEITALAPGLTSIPLTVTVVAPFKPSLGLSLPPKVRAGEQYSFAIGFYFGEEPVPYGPVPVYVSSSNLNLTVPTSVGATALGYGIGTLTAAGTGVANITGVMDGARGAAETVASFYSPVVGPVTYSVTASAYTGPLAGVPVNFTYDGRVSVTATGPSGSSMFAAFNDTVTTASVPSSITLENATYYFTGWSNGVKSENASLLSSAATFSITAQYFRSVVPTAYSLLALSDGQEPVAGLRFNVSDRASGENLTLTTNSQGEANFILPNASSFSISVPELYQPSGQTRYSLLSFDNSTRNVVNVTATTTIEAVYATYYQFEVASPIGNTTGSGWYRSGSTAAYSVDETSSGGPLVYQRFSGWSGNFSSGQPSGSTVITSPEFITAQWGADNSLLFTAVGAVLAGAAVVGLFIFRLKKTKGRVIPADM